ncbi:MAG: hypothetical protein HY879_17800 [Deltaproteobacteria bacterium]|nr:hypothetical protein [Deltaproteobacteria bacterium]
MARPIKVTPKLDAQSACVFLGRMVSQKTSGPIPTPKIKLAIQKIREDVKNNKK